ncbi:hypothetical protein T439DRAFT_296082, partial [Meredithblackwellia eburnea MCA 4105]
MTTEYIELNYSSLNSLQNNDPLLQISTIATKNPENPIMIVVHLNFNSARLTTASSSNHYQNHNKSSNQNESTNLPISWSQLHSLLSKLYSAAYSALIAKQHPLTQIDILIAHPAARQLQFCYPSQHSQLHKLQIQDNDNQSSTTVEEQLNLDTYPVVALGGTFDHLHPGHKILLTMASLITTERLIVGVTAPNLLTKKQHPTQLESLDERISNVTKFLQLVRPTIVHDVVPIEDIYGPTATDPLVAALVVSTETRSGGAAVNEERRRKGMSQLDVWEIGLIGEKEGEVHETGDKMGSTGLRRWLDE